MWFASMLSSGATSFGRLFVVGLLPNSVLVVWTYALVRADGFVGRSQWGLVLPRVTGTDFLAVLLLLLAVVILAVLLQPFQIRLVRVLEGYWDSWRLTAHLAPIFVERQMRKVELLRRRQNELTELIENAPALGVGSATDQFRNEKLRIRWSAELRKTEEALSRYPGHVAEGMSPDLLPTTLGNALRVAETTSGERYGLNTILSWPRMYPYFSDKFEVLQAAARDGLDASANLCVTFALGSALSVIALADEPKAYWIPLTGMVLCGFSYAGAVAAAVRYTEFVRVAYDLHRFDMLKALHYELPANAEDEIAVFQALSAFLSKSRSTDPGWSGEEDAGNFRLQDYYHGQENKSPVQGDSTP